MKKRQIFITEFDKKRLNELIASACDLEEENCDHLDDLIQELNRAKIVDPKEVPADVITMNSMVVLKDLETDKNTTYTLSFPNDADINLGQISVLAPIGTAILGYREGDIIEWSVPSGKKRLMVDKILYQPESAGDFDR